MLFLFANLQIRNQPSHKTKRSGLFFVRTASFYARLLRVVSYALATTRRKVRGGNGVLNVQRGRAVTHGHNVEIAGKFIASEVPATMFEASTTQSHGTVMSTPKLV